MKNKPKEENRYYKRETEKNEGRKEGGGGWAIEGGRGRGEGGVGDAL